MKVDLVVNNVNTKIVGNLNNIVLADLVIALHYKTKEYNGYTFVDIDHNLFNKMTQSFPTGLYSKVTEVLQNNNIEYDTIDKRILPNKFKSLKLHEVTPYDFQEDLINTAIENQRFVIQVATGGGKTIIGAGIFAKLNMPSIFVVHTGDLFEQAYDELSRMLKVPIGRIGGGICDIQKINVCMIQTIHATLNQEYIPFDDIEKELMKDDVVVKKSVQRNKEVIDFLKTVGVVLVDECFHGKTPIMIDYGKQVNIRDIYENKFIIHVISYNHEKNVLERKKILRKMKTPLEGKWHEVTIQWKDKIVKLKVTENHKFWTKNRGYIRVKDLTKDDILKFYTDEAKVVSIRYLYSAHNKDTQFKYNLEVEDNHNYFANSVLVSNCHHLRADSYITVMKACKKAFFRGGLCLHKNTRIQMADGRECKISSLFNFASKNNFEKIVDVIVFNLSKQIFENKKAKIIRILAKNKVLYKIKVRNYLNELIEIICSSEHKFFNYKIQKFVAAKDLVIGDTLFTLEKFKKYCLHCKKELILFDDPPAIIESIEQLTNNEEYLYDLCIIDDNESCHNFFANSILVHNSATPNSGDGRDIILQAHAGKIIGRITASYLIKRGLLVQPTIYFLNGNKIDKYIFSRKQYNSLYKKYIVNNTFRNRKILECVERFQELDKTVLITVTTKKHGQILQKMIRDNGHECEFIFSGVDKMQRKVHIQNVRERKLKIIIGTSLADEGLNIPTLDALILAGGGKSPTRMRQRIGRVLRLAKNKKEAFVVDFKDNVRYLLGHFKKRKEMCLSESEFKIVESLD